MSRDPVINDAVNAAMGAIRLVVAEHEGKTQGSGRDVVALMRELADKHGHRAVEITALFLAQAAAAGFEGLARVTEPPGTVEAVLADYQDWFETKVDFTLLTAPLETD